MNLCIALPSRPRELYQEIGGMFLDVLSGTAVSASLVNDGDKLALGADALLMIGDCLEFEGYATLLSKRRYSRPETILWLFDTLPPCALEGKTANAALRLRYYDRALHFAKTRLKPIRTMIPLPIRRKLGLAACSALLRGIREAPDSAQQELLKADVNSQYEIFGRYEWFSRHYPEGWLDHVFVNTRPNETFLRESGMQAEFIPLGSHPTWGVDMGIERDIDVIFFGELAYGRRKSIVEAVQRSLASRGITLTIVDGNCYGEDRTRLLNRAKISLNVPRFTWDIPTIRFFISMSCGVLAVSEEMGATEPFEAGKHLVQAKAEDLADVIIHYLQHEGERLAITNSASQLMAELTLRGNVFRVLSVPE